MRVMKDEKLYYKWVMKAVLNIPIILGNVTLVAKMPTGDNSQYCFQLFMNNFTLVYTCNIKKIYYTKQWWISH